MKPSNKELVFNAQSILKQFGYEVKTTHLHELFAKLAGFKNIHEATANKDDQDSGDSYYDREVTALEKYLQSRLERDDTPIIGTSEFEEVLQFNSYACRRFGLAVRAIQGMVVASVVEEHQPHLTEGTEKTIQEGMEDAETAWDNQSDATLQQYVPLGFNYVQEKPKGLEEYVPLTKEQYEKLKAEFLKMEPTDQIVEVIKGPNKGMIASLDNEEEGKAILYPYQADGNLCLGEYYMVPFKNLRTLSGEEVEAEF